MSYAFFYDVPGDERIYSRVKQEIGEAPAEGLLVQLVVKNETGGLRHFQVWDSKEHWRQFQDERVDPAVGKVLTEIGITGARQEPVVTEMNLVDLTTSIS